MSRSIHQTLRQVFFKKSKREVVEMCNPDNPDVDVIEIWKKASIKNNVKEQRKKEAFMRLEKSIAAKETASVVS